GHLPPDHIHSGHPPTSHLPPGHLPTGNFSNGHVPPPNHHHTGHNPVGHPAVLLSPSLKASLKHGEGKRSFSNAPGVSPSASARVKSLAAAAGGGRGGRGSPATGGGGGSPGGARRKLQLQQATQAQTERRTQSGRLTTSRAGGLFARPPYRTPRVASAGGHEGAPPLHDGRAAGRARAARAAVRRARGARQDAGGQAA
ncbi:hypothetical protein T492DRAFT_906528, partial [Pavlovales sp. CCMP2436]